MGSSMSGFSSADSDKLSGSFSEIVISAAARFSVKWKEGGYSSRKVVKEVTSIVGKGVYSVQSCAALLALENRIAERYSSILTTLLHYFSWKRESSLLNRLKGALKIPRNVTVAHYVRSSDASGDESAEGVRSGDGKRGAEKEEIKDKKEEKVSVKTGVQPSELKDGINEETERLMDEGEETSPDKIAVNEDKEECDKRLRGEEISPDSDIKDFSNRSDAYKIPENDVKKTDERSFKNKSEREIPVKNCAEAPAEKAVKRTSAGKGVGVLPTDVPLETYGRIFGQKTDGATPLRYEHYNRPSESVAPAAQSVRLNPAENKDGRVVPSEKSAERPSEFPSERQSESSARNAPLSEENKARIRAREEFAKMSEEEIAAVRQAMQESLDREMEIAEANGEIYKMPITVKEAFEKSDAERSERSNQSPEPDNVIKK